MEDAAVDNEKFCCKRHDDDDNCEDDCRLLTGCPFLWYFCLCSLLLLQTFVGMGLILLLILGLGMHTLVMSSLWLC